MGTLKSKCWHYQQRERVPCERTSRPGNQPSTMRSRREGLEATSCLHPLWPPYLLDSCLSSMIRREKKKQKTTTDECLSEACLHGWYSWMELKCRSTWPSKCPQTLTGVTSALEQGLPKAFPPDPDPYREESCSWGANLVRPPAHTPSEVGWFLSLGYPWEPRAWTVAGGVGHVGLFFP